MKKIAITCAATILFLVQTSIAQTSKKEKWTPVSMETAMKAMTDAGTPGQPHAMLAKAAGEWTAEMTMWMSPDGPPQVSKADVVNKMLFDGRYQLSDFSGDFGGMPFKGSSVTGYDNAKKVYFSSWIDNMSTTMLNMEGTWDEATKSIQLKGKTLCAANGKECEMREVYKIVDDNNHVMEMYGPDMKTGKEFKNMEIKFTRKG